jgi:hypothetical protein
MHNAPSGGEKQEEGHPVPQMSSWAQTYFRQCQTQTYQEPENHTCDPSPSCVVAFCCACRTKTDCSHWSGKETQGWLGLRTGAANCGDETESSRVFLVYAAIMEVRQDIARIHNRGDERKCKPEHAPRNTQRTKSFSAWVIRSLVLPPFSTNDFFVFSTNLDERFSNARFALWVLGLAMRIMADQHKIAHRAEINVCPPVPFLSLKVGIVVFFTLVFRYRKIRCVFEN